MVLLTLVVHRSSGWVFTPSVSTEDKERMKEEEKVKGG